MRGAHRASPSGGDGGASVVSEQGAEVCGFVPGQTSGDVNAGSGGVRQVRQRVCDFLPEGIGAAQTQAFEEAVIGWIKKTEESRRRKRERERERERREASRVPPTPRWREGWAGGVWVCVRIDFSWTELN